MLRIQTQLEAAKHHLNRVDRITARRRMTAWRNKLIDSEKETFKYIRAREPTPTPNIITDDENDPTDNIDLASLRIRGLEPRR